MIIPIVILSVTLIVIVEELFRREYRKNKTKISFRESLDLTGLPVITFYNKDKKLNFLLDTGSSYSVINSRILDTLEHEDIEGMSTEVMGMEGTYQETSFANIKIYLKGTEFTDDFQVIDMYDAFNAIKQETGVTIVGILGSSFFQKYKYVLDFKELAAYCK